MNRLLAWLDGDASDDPLPHLRLFARVFVLVLGAEYWARAIPTWSQLAPLYVWALGTVTVGCAATFVPGLARPAFALLAATHAAVIAAEFPATGNHAYLELYALLLLALLRPADPAEGRVLRRSLCWLVCLVLFASGLQKIAHGYYFQGQYLAYSLWIESFRPVLAPLFRPDEYARLTAFPADLGSGPFLVTSPAVLAVSNLVYATELLLPVLLLWPPTRTLGVAGTLAMLAGIEVAAREVFFGLVFANGVLLFLPRAAPAGVVLAVAAFLAWLLLGAIGVVPAMVYH